MSDMKCPICGQELKNINLIWFCENESCRAYDWSMEEDAWQELIRTRKALEIADNALETIGSYLDYNDCVGIALNARDKIHETLEQKE